MNNDEQKIPHKTMYRAYIDNIEKINKAHYPYKGKKYCIYRLNFITNGTGLMRNAKKIIRSLIYSRPTYVHINLSMHKRSKMYLTYLRLAAKYLHRTSINLTTFILNDITYMEYAKRVFLRLQATRSNIWYKFYIDNKQDICKYVDMINRFRYISEYAIEYQFTEHLPALAHIKGIDIFETTDEHNLSVVCYTAIMLLKHGDIVRPTRILPADGIDLSRYSSMVNAYVNYDRLGKILLPDSLIFADIVAPINVEHLLDAMRNLTNLQELNINMPVHVKDMDILPNMKALLNVIADLPSLQKLDFQTSAKPCDCPFIDSGLDKILKKGISVEIYLQINFTGPVQNITCKELDIYLHKQDDNYSSLSSFIMNAQYISIDELIIRQISLDAFYDALLKLNVKYEDIYYVNEGSVYEYVVIKNVRSIGV